MIGLNVEIIGQSLTVNWAFKSQVAAYKREDTTAARVKKLCVGVNDQLYSHRPAKQRG